MTCGSAIAATPTAFQEAPRLKARRINPNEVPPAVAAHQICRAGMGDRERSLILARRGVERARASELDMLGVGLGALRARVLRMVGGLEQQGELEAQIAATLGLIQRTDAQGWLPFVLLERAGLARMRGDADGMARDLAEARRLFAQMGATGWDDYARSIEA